MTSADAGATNHGPLNGPRAGTDVVRDRVDSCPGGRRVVQSCRLQSLVPRDGGAPGVGYISDREA